MTSVLSQLHQKFSQLSPQPASRPSVKREDPGLGDSLSSSVSSSQSSLTSSVTSPLLQMNTRSQHRSCESLTTTSVEGVPRRQSESFTKALQKFSSLSSSNITINLPALSSFPMPPEISKATDKDVQQSRTEKSFTNISTQTECLEDHGLTEYSPDGQLHVAPHHCEGQLQEAAHSYEGHLQFTPQLNSELYCNIGEMREGYYQTEYSQHYHMYSTLV